MVSCVIYSTLQSRDRKEASRQNKTVEVLIALPPGRCSVFPWYFYKYIPVTFSS
jgi:hypothetical protein